MSQDMYPQKKKMRVERGADGQLAVQGGGGEPGGGTPQKGGYMMMDEKVSKPRVQATATGIPDGTAAGGTARVALRGQGIELPPQDQEDLIRHMRAKTGGGLRGTFFTVTTPTGKTYAFDGQNFRGAGADEIDKSTNINLDEENGGMSWDEYRQRNGF